MKDYSDEVKLVGKTVVEDINNGEDDIRTRVSIPTSSIAENLYLNLPTSSHALPTTSTSKAANNKQDVKQVLNYHID